jgi:Lar family restriction alleviation protein
MDSTLEFCPFCGANAAHLEELGDDMGYAGVCGGCGSIGPIGKGRLDAAERWNQRTARARNLGLLRPE